MSELTVKFLKSFTLAPAPVAPPPPRGPPRAGNLH